MRPIDLAVRRMIRRHHPCERGLKDGIPREMLFSLLNPRTWRAHPAPFAKTRRGGQRRAERRFIAGRKCGFGCE